MLGVEGGHMIEDKLENLEALHKRGVRYLTLTWYIFTTGETSAADETKTRKDSSERKGLTDFGRQVVKRMNELGMLVDLSHAGEQTFWDAITIPVQNRLSLLTAVYIIYARIAVTLKTTRSKLLQKVGA